MQRQAAKRRRAVEVLCYRDKADPVAFELFHQAREIEQRAAEAIDFIDKDAIDLPHFDLHQQFSESRPVHAGSAETAIVITLGQHRPSRLTLAQDISLRRFALRLQGVEFLFEPFLGRLTGIDGAPENGGCLVHQNRAPLFSPKKANPFHRVPVTFQAMELRVSYVLPSNSKPASRMATVRVCP